MSSLTIGDYFRKDENRGTDTISDASREEEDEGRDTIDTDEIFEILRNGRRRVVLQYLQNNGQESTLRELTREVAARENGVEPAEITSKQRMRAYTGLRQSHLPKMDRAGVIDFDPDRGTVELRESATSVCKYMDDRHEDARSWPLMFVGIGLLGTASGLGLLSTQGWSSVISGPGFGLAVSITVLIASTVILVYDRWGR